MHARDLVRRFSAAVESDDPLASAKAELESLGDELDAVAEALSYLSGTGGNAKQAFFRSANLSLLKVRFPNGRRTPPHNHGTWAAILVLSGEEKNTLYLRDGDTGLRRVSEVVLERGSVLPMRGEAVHVAERLGDQPAIGLHVYGGDVLELPRNMWDPETLEMHPLDWTRYEGLAQKASAADGAP